jgi:hypothetical protein
LEIDSKEKDRLIIELNMKLQTLENTNENSTASNETSALKKELESLKCKDFLMIG